MARVAILGFGFSGLMVVANLVRSATRPLEIYIISPDASGLGIAYSTTHLGHLLNVPAGRMGAFADDVGGFHAWLQTQTTHQHFTPADFVPRAIYGQYLQSIWRDTQEMAVQKKLMLKMVPATATHMATGDELAVRTRRRAPEREHDGRCACPFAWARAGQVPQGRQATDSRSHR